MKPSIYFRKPLFYFIFSFSFLMISCVKDNNPTGGSYKDVNEFIWKGLNNYYLWQDSVAILDDDNYSDLNSIVKQNDNSELFFESLLYKYDEVDKWSWIVDDYVALEQYFQGVRKSTGAVIKLYYKNSSQNELFAVVRYVLPNSDAYSKNIQRGFVFDNVNGQTLTLSNYSTLINGANAMTINFGTFYYDSDLQTVVITPNGVSATLNFSEINQNPIYKYHVETVNGQKIGYLMYTSFTSDYDTELNQVFQYFKSENISELILDLRYNGGGSVQTAIYLSSMITGQFNGMVFSHEEWNLKIQDWLEDEHPEWLVNKFTNKLSNENGINSLFLDRVIVLTTGDSASASELVINCLKPYIEVLTIGTKTHGKYVASITLYDSEDFSKEDVNPDHHWAMQPIVLKEKNANGYYNPSGFSPDIPFTEDLGNLGELGTSTDLLFDRAMQFIENGSKQSQTKTYAIKEHPFKLFEKKEMFVEKKLPVNFLNK